MKPRTKKFCKTIFAIFMVLALFVCIVPAYEPASAASKPSKPKISVTVDAASATITIKKTKKAEGYMISAKLPGENKFTELATIELDGKKQRNYTVEDLPAGEYSIKVRAYLKKGDDIVWGKYSKVQTFTIKAGAEPTEPADYEEGEIILFGNYEQDNDLKNGTEPIEWIVYEVTDTDMYLISLRALTDGDISQKNKDKTITWENCDLRQWLNNDFYSEAFSTAEAAVITESTLSDTGTVDKIYLPSKEDMTRKDRIFGNKSKRLVCAPTTYAECKSEVFYVWTCITEDEWGMKEHKTIDDQYACYWWLRTSNGGDKFAMVDEAGEYCSTKYWGPEIKSCHTDYDGEPEYVEGYGVRPALRVNLSGASKVIKKTGRFFAGKITTNETVKDTCISLETAKKGDLVELGTYEQDNNLENGSEAIVWYVLDKNKDEITLLSKYALDVVPYNTSKDDTTWENCSLRAWLNDDFYNAAFADNEKELIQTTTVDKNGNSKHSVKGGATTNDNVYLLNMDNVINTDYAFNEDYHAWDIKRRCGLTAYAIAKGAYIGDEKTEDGINSTYWWLRSTGKDKNLAVVVLSKGYVLTDGLSNSTTNITVRPVITVSVK